MKKESLFLDENCIDRTALARPAGHSCLTSFGLDYRTFGKDLTTDVMTVSRVLKNIRDFSDRMLLGLRIEDIDLLDREKLSFRVTADSTDRFTPLSTNLGKDGEATHTSETPHLRALVPSSRRFSV